MLILASQLAIKSPWAQCSFSATPFRLPAVFPKAILPLYPTRIVGAMFLAAPSAQRMPILPNGAAKGMSLHILLRSLWRRYLRPTDLPPQRLQSALLTISRAILSRQTLSWPMKLMLSVFLVCGLRAKSLLRSPESLLPLAFPNTKAPKLLKPMPSCILYPQSMAGRCFLPPTSMPAIGPRYLDSPRPFIITSIRTLKPPVSCYSLPTTMQAPRTPKALSLDIPLHWRICSMCTPPAVSTWRQSLVPDSPEALDHDYPYTCAEFDAICFEEFANELILNSLDQSSPAGDSDVFHPALSSPPLQRPAIRSSLRVLVPTARPPPVTLRQLLSFDAPLSRKRKVSPVSKSPANSYATETL